MPTSTDFGDENTVDFAADTFLKRFTGEDTEESSATEETKEHKDTGRETEEADDDEGTSEETPEEDESDESEEGDEGQEEDEAPSKKAKKVILEPDAEAYVKHKVDGKDIEIKVSDLTRLYGQEAALTRKSQEAAELRKQSEEHLQRYATAHAEMLQRAQQRFAPYQNIDWLALTKDPNVSAETLKMAHEEAEKAWSDVQYHTQSLDKAVEDARQQRHQNLVKAGQEAWKVLSDPETGIKGWDQKMYGEITNFAAQQGIHKDVIKELVDPAAFKLIHMAMLYAKGAQASKETKVVNKTAKKIVKESAEPATKSVKSNSVSKADKRLKMTGSIDDAADAFLARFGGPKD